MKPRLPDNRIEMYSTQREGKYVVSERFIRTLENKIWPAVSKNMYIDEIDKIVDKHNKNIIN